jgi:glycosyltransferase involved in cell wall biosynthesis
MRILVHHRIASRDGQSVHLEELHAALKRQGHQTLLVGPPSFEATGFGGSSSVVDRIKQMLPGAVYELLEVAYNVKAWLRLRAAVKAFKPDIIYERFSLFLFAGLWVRRATGLPLLSEINAPLFEERARNDGLKLHGLGRWAQRMIWNNVDHCLPVTGVLADMVAGYGVPRERITVIPNGINPERFGAVPDLKSAKVALGLPPQRLVLGFTGFVRGWNAVHRLIDFVALHRDRFDLHVLLVGDGPARQSLEDHAAAKGVADRLTISGVVERDDVARYVAAFDVAVLPGVTHYASPLKLFEYLQLGRAIVAPDSANIREILADGKNALLFDPKRDGAMEEALLTLTGDATLRGWLGEAAKKTITEQSLTWGRNAQRVVAIAETIIRNRKDAPGP